MATDREIQQLRMALAETTVALVDTVACINELRTICNTMIVTLETAVPTADPDRIASMKLTSNKVVEKMDGVVRSITMLLRDE